VEGRWEFWIDRGGTFTDVVALRPDGTVETAKLLSENPGRYTDAPIAGIRSMMGVAQGEPLPVERISAVKMGTTVATNALLERTGERTVLVTTQGFGDALRIGTQARPDLFALDIVLPEMIYDRIVEAAERVTAEGQVLVELDEEALRESLRAARADRFDAVAIVFMHGHRHPAHEARAADIAHELGFHQVSVSHEVSPLRKLVPRGDTTVVDAYLSPVLGRYVDQVAIELPGVPLSFMQSNGGRADAGEFRGKDALLSGPAGGVVGMIRTAEAAGFRRLVGFDMGGTSTDVSHYAGEYERTYESEVAGVRVRAPMMRIHTVAAGGGSVCRFDGSRLRVGPESAGADPGPACYGRGGPATITDCNVVLGKLRAEYFPAAFGDGGVDPLDTDSAERSLSRMAAEVTESTGVAWTSADLAQGLLDIAVESMANAIKKISVQRGHDIVDHVLVCFGGAGGQHACLVADRLGVEEVLIDRHAGVLSALGVGVADDRVVRQHSVGATLDEEGTITTSAVIDDLTASARDALGYGGDVAVSTAVAVRYQGSDTALSVAWGDADSVVEAFEIAHRRRFGFTSAAGLVVDRAEVEAVRSRPTPPTRPTVPTGVGSVVDARHPVVMGGRHQDTPFLSRDELSPGTVVEGPAVIVEATATTVVEPGWQLTIGEGREIVMRRLSPRQNTDLGDTSTADPIQLEIFNNLFMHVAEQMGVVLENTAVSVNIKERLDFSCAVFDPAGDLVANAPHMPVHLGSMSESVKAVIASHSESHDPIRPGDVFVLNAPYNGGTHLPDVTVIKPVFDGEQLIFHVAARGHHADIGGVVPGSAPPFSTSVLEEGVLFDGQRLVVDGRFREDWLRETLTSGDYPARNPDQNVADLLAQVAACERGVAELGRVIDHYGLDAVHDYMRHVKANAEAAVRRLISSIGDGHFIAHGDGGEQVEVDISVDRQNGTARIDFAGTSGQRDGNRNAPVAVTQAAVLYVVRCLVDDEIPLNAGCLVPLDIAIPAPSMLAPEYPAAVIAGNVETSQLVVEALLGAFGTMAASQGTMNNVLFGNDRHQYYETLCGGAGATPRADGCDAVHTHMTNSRLTDPEILEDRFPVEVESFVVRRGSGGRGRHRGGDGVVRRIRFQEPMTLSLLTSRRVVAPYGMAGGEDGTVGYNRVVRADGAVDDLPGTAAADLYPGDVLEIGTPGGGGWGPVSSYRADDD
jgi:5-oxoprolinase (ATP-hydrolysing)